MGLTEKGFVRRTYDDILNDKIRRAKELFGEDINTSDQTPLGKFIRINAYDQAVAEEEIEQVYFARFPNTASGQSLDRLLPFVGITRNPAKAAAYSVKITGTAGHVIEAGFLVGTDTEISYHTTTDCTIGEDGSCVAAVSCTQPGAIGNLSSPEMICKPMNPDANISDVIGVEFISTGTDEESDADLRVRFAASVTGAGSCNENALQSAVLRIPTVQYSVVIANNTDEVDAEGRPPHSFETYVLGGDDYEQEIAQAIFEKRPVGITTVGDKTVKILDACGNEREVRYSPAQRVLVHVRIVVSAKNTFPEDGAAQIQARVAQHINGLGIGAPLILSSLYGHIYGVTGVSEVTTLELSTNGGSTFGAANVDVHAYGVAVCESVSVEVNAS